MKRKRRRRKKKWTWKKERKKDAINESFWYTTTPLDVNRGGHESATQRRGTLLIFRKMNKKNVCVCVCHLLMFYIVFFSSRSRLGSFSFRFWSKKLFFIFHDRKFRTNDLWWLFNVLLLILFSAFEGRVVENFFWLDEENSASRYFAARNLIQSFRVSPPSRSLRSQHTQKKAAPLSKLARWRCPPLCFLHLPPYILRFFIWFIFIYFVFYKNFLFNKFVFF